jgi:hypothetical protein
MWYNFVGEIEWQIFCQTLRVGVFSLGEQRLVKSTPGPKIKKGKQSNQFISEK